MGSSNALTEAATVMAKWYGFPFRIQWDRQNEPETWVDLFLLDQVVPALVALLEAKEDHWCIHRRWMNDNDGHVFRLECHSDESRTGNLSKTLDGHPALQVMRPLLLEWPIKREEGGAVLATGNSHWLPRTKSAYPVFIQRVCQTFCEVLDELKAEVPSARPDCTSQSAQAPSLQSVRDYYSALESKVDELWYGDGADAFFHMTHAVFGYRPFRARLTLASVDHVGILLNRGCAIYPDHVVVTDIRTLDVPPLVKKPVRA